MELQPDLHCLLVADRHRHAVDLRVHTKSPRRLRRAQRVITADMDRTVDPREGAASVVANLAGFSMHRHRCLNDASPGFEDDGLVAKADAEQWDPAEGQ